MSELGLESLNLAFYLLGEYLDDEKSKPFHLVVCGGAALIACSLVSRTTADVDIVALLNDGSDLISPDPLPDQILQGAEFVRKTLESTGDELPDNWLNNAPSRHPGGLFQTGLPTGVLGRLIRQNFGPRLSVYFLSRYDQIHLKLYAATDSGPGRHVEDLLKLNPSGSEIEAAAQWALTQDPSAGFRTMLVSMLNQLGFENEAERI